MMLKGMLFGLFVVTTAKTELIKGTVYRLVYFHSTVLNDQYLIMLQYFKEPVFNFSDVNAPYDYWANELYINAEERENKVALISKINLIQY